MKNKLCNIEEVIQLINADRILLLAGDETILEKLPNGKWIAGTIPYFMDPDGGIFSKEKIHVIDLTDAVTDFKIKTYNENTIQNIVNDEYENGFTFLILPALQPVWHTFALNSSNYPNMFMNPLVGWVAGTDFSEFGKTSPKTFNANTKSANLGVAMHLKLPNHLIARAEIINLYEPGDGETIVFPQTGFDSSKCFVNGKEQSLYHYLRSVNSEERFPIVANYSGAYLNVGYIWDRQAEVANIYAPVFKNVEYKIVKSKEIDYEKEFEEMLERKNIKNLTFACNCLMNYFTFGLEGKKLAGISGPITFGEIAYQVLNQTFVYLVIEEK